MISTKDILELETRRNIYNFILNNPGLYERKICREIGMSYATLKYHLSVLKKRDLITSVSTGRYHNYFAKERVDRKDKKVLSLLKKDTYRTIILGLFITINSTRSRLIQELDLEIHPNTLTYHLKKLEKMDVIEISPVEDGIIIGVEHNLPKIIEYSVVSNEKLYRLKDPQQIYDLLVVYRDDLEQDLLMHFIFELMEYREEYGYNERVRIRTRKEKVDSMLELIYEIFPHPYHC